MKRPGVLSKVQMLNLVLGVGVFSLLPILAITNHPRTAMTGRLCASEWRCTILVHFFLGAQHVRSLFSQGLGAYQSVAQKIKVPFPGFSPSFCSFEGLRAISKPEPNPDTHQTPVEMLSEHGVFRRP